MQSNTQAKRLEKYKIADIDITMTPKNAETTAENKIIAPTCKFTEPPT